MKATQFLFLAFAAFGMTEQVVAKTMMEGIHIPEFRMMGEHQLKRHGQGIRSVSFFGMPIKVYVAGFYSLSRLENAQDVLESLERNDNPMQLDFTFLRGVSGKQCTQAWQQQLEHSVSHHYEGYENDRDDFIQKLSNPISYGGTISIKMVGDDTVIVDQGKERGVIPGRNFQRAFLSMWFGEQPVTEDIKAGFLEGAVHRKLSPVAA
ncbi:unnamed protein product [Cylindrotheca closterium]|uniref:Chalcone isomerase domain-containing protein n=1 Tax=Cylindrotheca closterium TaxID=2856 RepID=A0AAD2FJL6_9STRA|nr:unnamed protein product [Cylindrotheca closterium]